MDPPEPAVAAVPAAPADYDAWRRAALRDALRWAQLASIGALGLFAVIDSYLRVDKLETFLVVRTATMALLLVLGMLTAWPPAARHIDWLATLTCLAAAVSAVVIAELAGGGLSLYRDPIYLVFVGFAALMPWQPWAAAACFIGALGCYNGLYFFAGGTGYLSTWLLSNVMLAAAAALATAGARSGDRLRRAAFAARATSG